jgi:hypothetical protein
MRHVLLEGEHSPLLETWSMRMHRAVRRDVVMFIYKTGSHLSQPHSNPQFPLSVCILLPRDSFLSSPLR